MLFNKDLPNCYINTIQQQYAVFFLYFMMFQFVDEKSDLIYGTGMVLHRKISKDLFFNNEEKWLIIK